MSQGATGVFRSRTCVPWRAVRRGTLIPPRCGNTSRTTLPRNKHSPRGRWDTVLYFLHQPEITQKAVTLPRVKMLKWGGYNLTEFCSWKMQRVKSLFLFSFYSYVHKMTNMGPPPTPPPSPLPPPPLVSPPPSLLHPWTTTPWPMAVSVCWCFCRV